MPRDPHYRRIEKNITLIYYGLALASAIGIIALVLAAVDITRPLAVTLCNVTCVNGTNGANGVNGTNGAAGSFLDYANFYSKMPGNNSATIGVGTDLSFATSGPARVATGITAIDSKSYQIAAVGVYYVTFFVSVDEAGQLEITLNNAVVTNTITGRATGTNYITGSYLITVAAVNTTLTVRNPAGNPSALTITPIAGGASTVSCHLTIFRLT